MLPPDFFVRVESLAVTSLWCKVEPIWTQGGVLQFLNSGDDRMGAKIKPPKIRRASNKSRQIPQIKISLINIPCRISAPLKFPESIK